MPTGKWPLCPTCESALNGCMGCWHCPRCSTELAMTEHFRRIRSVYAEAVRLADAALKAEE